MAISGDDLPNWVKSSPPFTGIFSVAIKQTLPIII
jgi:hypothetical protein